MANNHQEIILSKTDFEIAVVGGGLSGLVAAIELASKGFDVVLFEKKSYPFHKVCGEYLSREVVQYLKLIGLNLDELNLPEVTNLELVGVNNGANFTTKLQMGGIGISRYMLDESLFKISIKNNVQVYSNTKVSDIQFAGNLFTIKASGHQFTSKFCIGGYGKRELIDKALNRDFIFKKNPFMAVKYHVKANYKTNTIGIFHFKGGYCGISPIENDKFCLCYLSHRSNMKGCRSLGQMEKKVLYQNSELRKIFENSNFIFDKPLVINEISFSAKPCIENHILMCGDTAGMISPLCGNGMAIAIHSAKILSNIIISNIQPGSTVTEPQRLLLENLYQNAWDQQFKKRLQTGRMLQSIAGNTWLANLFFMILRLNSNLSEWVIRQTHGVEISKND